MSRSPSTLWQVLLPAIFASLAALQRAANAQTTIISKSCVLANSLIRRNRVFVICTIRDKRRSKPTGLLCCTCCILHRERIVCSLDVYIYTCMFTAFVLREYSLRKSCRYTYLNNTKFNHPPTATFVFIHNCNSVSNCTVSCVELFFDTCIKQ